MLNWLILPGRMITEQPSEGNSRKQLKERRCHTQKKAISYSYALFPLLVRLALNQCCQKLEFVELELGSNLPEEAKVKKG